jgi:hypothetical protein
MVVFGALHIRYRGRLLWTQSDHGGWAGFSFGLAFYRILDAIALALRIVPMLKAHQ